MNDKETIQALKDLAQRVNDGFGAKIFWSNIATSICIIQLLVVAYEYVFLSRYIGSTFEAFIYCYALAMTTAIVFDIRTRRLIDKGNLLYEEAIDKQRQNYKQSLVGTRT